LSDIFFKILAIKSKNCSKTLTKSIRRAPGPQQVDLRVQFELVPLEHRLGIAATHLDEGVPHREPDVLVISGEASELLESTICAVFSAVAATFPSQSSHEKQR
jgi:hypothetical protein